jgi:muconate cycloisomerase
MSLDAALEQSLPLKIGQLEAIAVRLPMAKPMNMSGSVIRFAENVLVRIEDHEGRVGWGEAGSAPSMTGETVQSMVAAVRYLAPHLRGQAAADLARIHSLMRRLLYANSAAKSAVDMALYDLLGKARGKSVFELLGSKRRDSVRVLWMLGTGQTGSDIEEALAKSEQGYEAFKIKVGTADPAADAKRTRQICAVIPQARLVSADANQGWNVEQALGYLAAVEAERLDFLEQPVAADDLPGMARIAAASRIAIACDEGLHSVSDIDRHYAARAAAGGSLKSIKLGGIGPLYRAALHCETLGMKVNLACKIAESGIATAAILHLAAAIPAVAWGVSLSSQYLAEDVLRTPLQIVEGCAQVPAGPGLGIEVDEQAVRRHRMDL